MVTVPGVVVQPGPAFRSTDDAAAIRARRRVIGVLGAQRGAIVSMFVGRGVRLASLGAAAGIAGAMSIAKVVQTQLYETAAVSAPIYAGAAAIMIVVGACAAWWPARQTVRVGLVSVLRDG